jgi:hypothetical protein
MAWWPNKQHTGGSEAVLNQRFGEQVLPTPLLAHS